MKNVILSVVIALVSSSIASANCSGDSCARQPVRRVGTVVVDTTKRIVTAPFRAVKTARVNRINRVNSR